MLREAAFDDLNALLELYLHLHEDAVPAIDEHLKSTWDQIIGDPNHHIIVNEIELLSRMS